MAILAVTRRGQVTFRKEILQHLGIEPGDRIELDLLPGGKAALRAAKPAGNIEDFLGMFAGRSGKIASIEDMNEAIADGWAGK